MHCVTDTEAPPSNHFEHQKSGCTPHPHNIKQQRQALLITIVDLFATAEGEDGCTVLLCCPNHYITTFPFVKAFLKKKQRFFRCGLSSLQYISFWTKRKPLNTKNV